jgi:hypothetical protein
LVALLSLGAGAIHFDILSARWHEHILYGLFFTALAVFQVAWAFGIALRPRRLYAVGIVVNALTLVIYVVAHTTGLPAGPEAWQRVPSGAADIICAFFELGIVVLSLVLVFRHDVAPRRNSAAHHRWPLPDRVAAGISAVLMLFVVAGTGAALATTGGGTTNTAQSTAAATSGHARESNADPSWHYPGAPLPASEVGEINAIWKATAPGEAFQTPTCTFPPTNAQNAAASGLVNTTDAAVAKYRDINVAKADGYVPITTPQYVLVHYIKYSNMGADKVLDPNHIQMLLYSRRPNGQMVLAAAVYAMPRLGQSGPMPGGCRTQWYVQTNLCMTSARIYAGFSPCPAGTMVVPTTHLLRVWQVPVPGGQLAVDPTHLQVAEAAEMYATAHSGNGGSKG